MISPFSISPGFRGGRFALHTVLAMLVAAVLASVWTPSLFAQQIASPYSYVEDSQYGGVFAGYLWTGGLEPDLGPQPAPVAGALYGIRFSGPLSGEAALGLIPSERTVFRNAAAPQDSVNPVAVESTDMLLLFAEGALRLNITGPRTWNGLMPFLLAGGGLVADLSGDSGAEIEDAERFDFGPALAVSVGAGTEWFVSERLSLRLEVRDRLWRLTVPAGLTEGVDEDARWTNNLGLSVGASLHF